MDSDGAAASGAVADRVAGRRRWPIRLLRHRVAALGTVAASIAVFWVAAWAYAHWATGAPRMVGVALAGTVPGIARVVDGHEDRYVHALHVDFGFVAGYVLAIVLATALGYAMSTTAGPRRLFGAALVAGVAAGLLDVVENIALLQVIPQHRASEHGWALLAQACAFTKFTLVLPAAALAIVAILVTVWRALCVPVLDLLPGRRAERDQLRPDDAGPLVSAPAGDVDAGLLGVPDDDRAVRHAAWRAHSALPQGRERGGTGFCVSGGGIRSATFALGALDALRAELSDARYLVSVSGGGYAAGAMQLALQPAFPDRLRPPDRGAASIAEPADVFGSGSSELDHTRRHGRYLADGGRQWMVAIVTILRGVIVNLLLLGLLIVLVGRLVAHAYASFPNDPLSTGTWPPPEGVSWAAGALAGLTVLLWVVGVLTEPGLTAVRRVLRIGMFTALAGSVLVAVVGIGLPLLSWLCRTPSSTSTLVVSSQTTSVVGGWIATMVALGSRPSTRATVAGGLSTARTWYGKAGAGQKSILARLIVALGLLAVLAGLLLLLGVVLATTGTIGAVSSWPGGLTEWQVTLVLGVVLIFFLAVDQVRWSLHPFYRRRLATAFSVRRLRRGGEVSAVAYDYDREPTWLAGAEQTTPRAGGKSGDNRREPSYDARVPGFPQVIFSCAAHVSGQEVAPPGRQVVPWTMSGDYVGSPMIGWIATGRLAAATSPTIRRDLTVQAAQAISGAAIASQMGRMNRTYSKLLTLTNARLGSWLPNPRYLQRLGRRQSADWWRPRLPRRRHLSTLGRELFGHYPQDGPLIYVTDGGHYENLGLVELLRHRCSNIVCVDASGDGADVAATLAQAVELAYEELGVEIRLDNAGDLGAGTGMPHATAPDQLIAELQNRLAKSCVVTGSIHYPALGDGLAEAEGTFVLGKAVLTPSTPFDLLAYATDNPAFPNDSTADQWFDFSRFDAYHALGRYVGARIRAGIGAAAEARAPGMVLPSPVMAGFARVPGAGLEAAGEVGDRTTVLGAVRRYRRRHGSNGHAR